jgi:uncharacterized protein (DUF1778 family)
MTATIKPTVRKDMRLAVRLRSDQDSLIRQAAETSGQSVTEFVTTAAIERATDTLADRLVFKLDDEAWTQFTAILDRPAKPIPELVKLLHQRAPWDED